MRFLIHRVNDVVALDNAPYALDTSSLDPNVFFVHYDTDTTAGGIQNISGPALRILFTDPSPYQSFIDAWCTTAAADSPPLSLASAQSIAKAFVTAVFNSRRQLPILYNAAQWSALDADLAAMGLELANAASQIVVVPPQPVVFTTSQTITIPPNVTSAKVILVGGGGGAVAGLGGAAGGAGGAGQKLLTGLVPGNTLILQNGGGGAGAGSGSSTILSSGTQTITTLTAFGGAGDNVGGGAGGGGTSGPFDLSFTGGHGQANSGGANPYCSAQAVQNQNGLAYGGGAFGTTVTVAGANGVCIIEWYGGSSITLPLTAKQLDANGTPTTVGVTLAQAQALVGLIKARTDQMVTGLNALQAAIMAATSVAAVVAIDLAAGWPILTPTSAQMILSPTGQPFLLTPSGSLLLSGIAPTRTP